MADDSTPATGRSVATQTENTREENVQQRWDELLFGVRRSVLYHRHRQRHFDNLNRWKTAITLLSGSAAMVTLQTQLHASLPTLPFVASAIVTVISTVELVVGTSTKARLHADLSRRFLELERTMTLIPQPTMADLQKYTADRLLTEADEPPILRMLDVLCHNELMRAEGYEWDDLAYVPWYHRLQASFRSMPDKVRTQTIGQWQSQRNANRIQRTK